MYSLKNAFLAPSRMVFAVGAIAVAATACSDNNTTTVGAAARLVSVSGDLTVSAVGSEVGPFIVKVTDTAGNVIQGTTVHFVGSGGITLANTTATTDVAGTAFTSGTFTHTSGSPTITATVDGIATPVVFHTTSQPEAASALIITGGNGQVGVSGAVLPELLAVQVTDQYGNPIPGVLVNWTAGSGTLGATTSHSDASGRASITFAPAKSSSGTVSASVQLGSGTVTVNFTESGT